MIQLAPKRNSYQCLQVIVRQRTMNLSPNTRILWPVENDKLDILKGRKKTSSTIPEQTSENTPYDTKVLCPRRKNAETYKQHNSRATHQENAKTRIRTKRPKLQSLCAPQCTHQDDISTDDLMKRRAYKAMSPYYSRQCTRIQDTYHPVAFTYGWRPWMRAGVQQSKEISRTRRSFKGYLAICCFPSSGTNIRLMTILKREPIILLPL